MKLSWKLLILGLAVTIFGLITVRFSNPQDVGQAVAERPDEAPAKLFLNEHILAIVGTYPLDGRFRTLPTSEMASNYGVTRDIYYAGSLRMTGDKQLRSYCSGIVIEVYLAALEKSWRLSTGNRSAFLVPEIPSTEFKQFRRDFYGTDGNRKTFVRALVDRQLGEEINGLGQAQPGDLVQYWRHTGTGHAGILIDVRFSLDGNPESIMAWSSQKSTSGVGYLTEQIGNSGRSIDANQVYIVRARASRE